jgi:hypothetical protein
LAILACGLSRAGQFVAVRQAGPILVIDVGQRLAVALSHAEAFGGGADRRGGAMA